jgi:ABC-type Fe3+-hydroxamate transport system substrate-binding protein
LPWQKTFVFSKPTVALLMQRTFTDQLGTSVKITFPLERIISLVPSQTELLHSFGLENEVVGITKFCVHPQHWKSTKTIVGGTKTFRFDVIDALQPDLIIGNKEENYEQGIVQLREKYPVWMSDVISFEDSLSMIKQVGELTDRTEAASELAENVIKHFSNLIPINIKSRKILYLIWRKPWMAAAKNTFIDSMLTKIGLQNAVADSRYPELNEEAIRKMNPELIFLSSEPYPFQENHIQELQALVPNAKIILVDGECFSWYGSRMLVASEYFRSLLTH